MVDLLDELDGYTASFTSVLEDIDATPLLKGLPDDRCQCPHWGYVFKGKMIVVSQALAAAATAAGHAPSIHNTQPWRWRLTGNHMDLYVERSRVLEVTDPTFGWRR